MPADMSNWMLLTQKYESVDLKKKKYDLDSTVKEFCQTFIKYIAHHTLKWSRWRQCSTQGIFANKIMKLSMNALV